MIENLDDDYAKGFHLAVYRAENRAAARHPAERLDGTQKAAQAYVDRITRSSWWRKNCAPSWFGDHTHETYFLDTSQPPKRVIVEQGRAGGHAWSTTVFPHLGKWYPKIRLGTKTRNHSGLNSIENPWVILHELAHVMSASAEEKAGHGREFAYWMMLLVRRWLGAEAAAVLREEFAREKVKYRKKAA